MPKRNRGPPPDSRLELHGEEEKEYLLSLGNSQDILEDLLEARIQARKYYAERQRQQLYYEKNRAKKLQCQRERYAQMKQTETPAQKDARKAARRVSQEDYRHWNRDYLRAQQAERYRLKHARNRTSAPQIRRSISVFSKSFVVMPSLDWPTTPLPPFQRPSHWPSFIDHDNIYLTGEAEKEAILSAFDIDENTREDVRALLVETYVAKRAEYRRRMEAIRPQYEMMFR
ncbi:hypothetical protein F5880DRAFT_1619666 [Lentinula raphanica]|nr:hypothetical protein F5880DRAFT_1619666 [Lentinula raphanica]